MQERLMKEFNRSFALFSDVGIDHVVSCEVQEAAARRA